MPSTALDDALDVDASWVALPGGTPLAEAGEPASALYRLVAGRLAEVEKVTGNGERLTAVHRPGAVIGAAQILSDEPYGTTVTALRDSELLAIPADRVDALMRQNPEFLTEMARSALSRMGAATGADQRKSSILGFVAVCDGVAMRELVERLARAMRAVGVKVAVLGVEADDSPPTLLSALEAENDYVLMSAERRELKFAAYCGRQIDRLILVGGADTPLPDGPITFAAAAIRRHHLLDFVLVQPADTRFPANSERWLSAAPASRLFQIRQGDGADLARLARIYAGKSVGLALSGGGARAYAHVGAAKALRQLGVPIDFLAGTSMGAVIAAGLAMGWDLQELDRRIRQAFVESSPLSDIALPLLAMTRGRRVDHRLETHFGDTQISDLWRPFACVSTDLTTGGPYIHRRGLLRRALRASLSLPGVLPPVVENGHVLVDGALVRNLPVDVVREQHDGVTIGVDVAVAQGLKPDDLLLRPSGWRWLTSGAWRKGPPIVSVLIRSATLPSVTAMAAARDSRIVEIIPDVEGVELQDWNAFDKAVEAGYRATMEAAERLAPLKA
ncbi:MAG: cyclic nucleotide-binding protein [Caulobacteraceae bacterium]|jgi:NTE family protein|nr:cyclic nucleotide-binding protein [Caulobacteraceae bacterium]